MIELRNVEMVLGGEKRLENINLKINKGDVVGVIGPSGSGKSLLLRTMALLDAPKKGEIILDGEVIDESAKDIHFSTKKIGMCFQDAKLFNHMTVIENVMCPLMDIYDIEKQRAYDISINLLRRVGLGEKQFLYPDELTSGEKQRVAIMQVVALDPLVYLFDDPTSKLDVDMRREIQKVILKIANLGNTVVLASNDITFVKKVCNRIVYVDEKTIYEEGKTDEFFACPKKEKTAKFLKGIDSIVVQIDSPYFDFLGVSSRIAKFSQEMGFSIDVTNKMYVCFEELCKNIVLLELLQRDKFSINIVYDFDRVKRAVVFTMKYSGDPFDPKDAKDELAFLIFNHSIGGYKYKITDDAYYPNKITIEIPV